VATLKSHPDHPQHGSFGRISFPLAKQTPALQAADLLVHLTYRHVLARMEKHNWFTKPSEILATLNSNRRNAEGLCY
jgi:hypothetical protein